MNNQSKGDGSVEKNTNNTLENLNTSLYTADYILSKALDIGENILKCGGEPHRIEDTINRICSAYGAVKTDVFAITSLIVVGIRMKDGTSCTQVRRVYKTANNMYRLDMLNDISRKVCSGEITLDEVDSLIEYATRTRPFTKYLVIPASMLAAGGFAIFFGGNYWDGLAAAIAGFIVSVLNLHKIKLANTNLYTVFVSFIGAVTALGINKLGIGDNVDMIMIGTIMLLIPGLAFGNAVRDLLFGDTVSGLIQFVQALLTAIMVAFGFIVAIMAFGGVFI